MSDGPLPDLPLDPPGPPAAPGPTPEDPRRRGWPLVAWLVIAAVVAVVLWRGSLRRGKGGDGGAARSVTFRLQSRYVVGLVRLGLPPQQAYDELSKQREGASYGQRLGLAVLAGELAGPEKALAELRRLEKERRAGELRPPPGTLEIAALLWRLYAAYQRDVSAGPALTAAQQRQVREKLGWFGELALAPAGGPDEDARARALSPALRTVVCLLAGAGLGVLGLLAGGALLLVMFVLAVSGRLSGGLRLTGHGGIYAETFALYLVVFLALGVVLRLVPVPAGWGLAMQAVAALASLVSLAWPGLRGVPWAQVRDDLGLRGERAWLGVPLGVGTYLSALPVLLLGVLVMLTLMFAQRRLGLGQDPLSPGGAPSHPVVGMVEGAGLLVWLQIFVTACVVAPLVEETMFRGLLYRHLREASAGWGKAASIVAAGLGSSFVFAIIHPQGLLGVPPLMALACTFALAREWRGSLVAPMIAHGINNGMVMMLLFVATS